MRDVAKASECLMVMDGSFDLWRLRVIYAFWVGVLWEEWVPTLDACLLVLLSMAF